MITSTTPSKKITEFVIAIKRLADSKNKYPDTSTIYRFVSDAFELIHYHEWGIALENLLENLYEVKYPLDKQAIKLAKEAILACKMDYSEWSFIEELKK